jgi:hypothetical protein
MWMRRQDKVGGSHLGVLLSKYNKGEKNREKVVENKCLIANLII